MRNILKDKKGLTMYEVPMFALMLVIAIIITSAGSLALDGFQDTVTADSHADNITKDGNNALGNLSAQFPTIGTIAGVAILITLVVGAFYAIRKQM